MNTLSCSCLCFYSTALPRLMFFTKALPPLTRLPYKDEYIEGGQDAVPWGPSLSPGTQRCLEDLDFKVASK